MDYNTLIKKGIEAALAGGNEILNIYKSQNLGVEIKKDNSPVTLADKHSSKAILDVLYTTGIPIICEEEKIPPYEVRSKWEYLWMIDPLDGTKEFIKQNGEFCVCIGYIEDNNPILGIIYIPTTQEIFYGGKDIGSFKMMKNQFKPDFKVENGTKLFKKQANNPLIVTGSRSHGSEETELYFNQLKAKHPKLTFLKVGSAIKFCRLAEGKVDLYPRFQLCMEWDTAAGHAIINGIGKEVFYVNKKTPLVYNKEDLYSPYFIAK